MPEYLAYLASGHAYVLQFQKLRDTSFMHDLSYDKQCFLEISRTPLEIIVGFLSKASFTVVSSALTNFVSSGFYLNQLE